MLLMSKVGFYVPYICYETSQQIHETLHMLCAGMNDLHVM